MVAWIQAHGYPGNAIMTAIMVLVALLMVSRLPMFSLKFTDFGWRTNFRRYILLAAAAIFVITEGLPGLAWAILLYILISAHWREWEVR